MGEESIVAKTSLIQAIRGMNDILPDEIPVWQYLESILQALMRAYAYQEIRTPILEETALFKRSVGEITDIVEKEMYTFLDRNGDSLSLRPEGTASCMRACLEHGLVYHQVQRLWYVGPMFRHERPQKGRYRQFYQFTAECLGVAEPSIDVELILLTSRLWKHLGLSSCLEFQLNSLGLLPERENYKKVLVTYFSSRLSELDEDSQRRLKTNPLRILDSKNPEMQSCIAGAPVLSDHLGEVSQAHFHQVKTLLDKAGVAYRVNPRLVRGLDYYSHTVFEWVTTQLGAQGTVCAGGRYDSLAQQLGGMEVPGVGFSMGLERIIALLISEGLYLVSPQVDVYLLYQGGAAVEEALLLAETIHNRLPELRLLRDGSGGKLTHQFKRADKSGAVLALILGEQESRDKTITIKFLRQDKPQITLAQDKLIYFLEEQSWKIS